MEILAIAIVATALVIMGILIANIKILTAKEATGKDNNDMNKTKNTIFIGFGILAALLLVAYLIFG
ncbi:hypothetical protein CR194_04155 [Salipaludibacillus keqinensis]|uniref:Uncharacterized protein n=1 Tax=Salipaludibacillus keqinensis TaxID=2045207 RepID=A0A323TQG0_9BACI|nr:hypothetical protein [Salipaludibacillus keqinensis]PYZ94733.1 hypothetical protein CR194_04155 [Salipaludibacillus keqinensis]